MAIGYNPLAAPLIVSALLSGAAAFCCAAEGPRFILDDWAPSRCFIYWSKYFHRSGGAGGVKSGQNTLLGLSFEASREHEDAPLPRARTDGYGVTYPDLHRGDVIPLFSFLYRVGLVPVDVRSRHFFLSADRLTEAGVPPDVEVPLRTYVFPLNEPDDDHLKYSGRLHGEYVYVWGLRREGDAVELRDFAARVGLLQDVERSPLMRSDSIRWRWVRAGDMLEIGGYRHRVVAIVPTRELDSAGRDRARMIGWIELDPKAEKIEPPTP